MSCLRLGLVTLALCLSVLLVALDNTIITTGGAEMCMEDGMVAGRENTQVDDDTNVNMSIGVLVSIVASGPSLDSAPQTPPLVTNDHLDQGNQGSNPNGDLVAAELTTTVSHAEELVVLVTMNIIPLTYPDFLEYHTEHKPEASGSNSTDLTQIQFRPLGYPHRTMYKDGLQPPASTLHTRSAFRPTTTPSAYEATFSEPEKLLLLPISLL
ncbi:hypothetical protein DFH07DRAFT_953143 [Mycena maculata]|uniref:Uncharacterized protein n=1 Tax=Mycena maculata TaxID=230809 RepID=A0AAD7JVL7_9AGAR|nr:hypothetical protein DFH07DRAFT_953143 [Mycena maculata]